MKITISILANLLAWGVMLVYFAGLPLYVKNGYTGLASNKYLFFMEASKYTAIVAGSFLLLRICFWGFSREEILAYKEIRFLDSFLLLFGLFSMISHWSSAFRTNTFGTYYLTDWFYEGSKWGTRGWFMGLMTYLIFIMLYFILSRCLIYHVSVFIPLIVSVTLVSGWGVLNRFGYAPVNMDYTYGNESAFLASIGNINWLCGFTAVLVPILWGLYLTNKTKWLNPIYLFCITVSFAMIIVNGSDSGYFALAVTMGVLLGYSFPDEVRMKKFVELSTDFFLVCNIIWILERFNKVRRTSTSGLIEPLIGVPSALIIVVLTVIYVFLRLAKKEYPVKTMLFVRKIYIYVSCIGIFLLISLIVLNTILGGRIPIIGKNPLFIFNSSWGSKRGITWSLGMKTFLHLDFWHKLVGAGPDTMFYTMIGFEDLSLEWSETFGSSRLTNAHNEIITLLVNIGIFGTAAFIGMIATAIGYAFKKAKEYPEFICFALAVISYVTSNIFSFQQITNTPFLFLVLGIEGAALVSVDKKAVLLTKKDKKNTIQKGKKSRK